jgi:hypothetical protein
MQKPNLYVDTSIISAYWYDGKDPLSFGRRTITREWWTAERLLFELSISAITTTELEAGEYRHKSRCIAMAKRIKQMPITATVESLAEALMEQGIVPKQKAGDSFQLAAATIHKCDYLLTWNYAHLANPVVQVKMDQVCSEKRLTSPLLVSPETIP